MRPCSRLFVFLTLCSCLPAQEAHNQLTSEEKASGWKLLFDGKTFTHWIDPLKRNPQGKSWAIENGSIKALAKPYIQEDLITAGTYQNFELVFDWKVSPGGNSGVKYRLHDMIFVDESKIPADLSWEQKVAFELDKKVSQRSHAGPGRRSEYTVAFEYQVIDNDRHKDAQRGPLYQAGALYSMIPASQPATKPVGEWNHARIVLRGDNFEHWLNGVRVAEGSLKGKEVTEAVEKRWKPAPEVRDMLLRSTRPRWPIALQNHGDEAWFRNIKLRQFTGRPD
ncbi:MAG TPA: DUF1080 domain-containing protein [Bryobacteraceae bacterium]|nr:DUF1080 domain-containing protein [Bryobacteraceae bacterium]